MNPYQEPKYAAEADGKLYNRQSGVAIPEDEPVMVFRARDCYAAMILEEYARRLPAGMHKEAAQIRAIQFRNWAEEHPERMKEPDTQMDGNWSTAGSRST